MRDLRSAHDCGGLHKNSVLARASEFSDGDMRARGAVARLEIRRAVHALLSYAGARRRARIHERGRILVCDGTHFRLYLRFCRCRGNGGRDRASEQYAVVPAHDLCLSRGDVRRLSVRHDLLLLYMAFLYARFGCLGGALDVQYFVYFQGYRALCSGGAARQKTFADRQ